jgi:PAS domain S-box-containing protein
MNPSFKPSATPPSDPKAACEELPTLGPIHPRPPSTADQATHRHLKRLAQRPGTSRLLASLPVAVAAFDRGWRYLYANEEAQKMLGRTARELIGNVVWDVFPEAKELDSFDYYRRAMEQQEEIAYEEYAPFLARWIEHRLFPSPTGLMVIARDLTEWKLVESERMRLETALAESQEQLRLLKGERSERGRTEDTSRLRTYLTLFPNPGAREAIIAAHRESNIVAIAVREGGCLSSELQLSPNPEGPIVVSALWESREDFHRFTLHPARIALGQQIGPLLADVRVDEYEVVYRFVMP